MLGRVFRRWAARTPGARGGDDYPDPAPQTPIYAVGDIHGRADLLEHLLVQIERDGAEAADGPPPRLVFLGDYVDRGEASRAVLERLFELSREAPDRVVCLRGNHEQMMCDFLAADDPGAAVNWLRNGGVETMASFGVRDALDADHPGALHDAADRLRAALGADLAAWLHALPLHWSSGNVHCVHGGADPALPMAQQSGHTLLWGHSGCGRPRADRDWVVHGHTIRDEPVVEPGRVCIDTGAWFTGRLTAARIATGELRFLST